jgi:hypothetical protein
MYFTKKLEIFEDAKEFAIKKNFKYMFDCTGKRLNAKFNINKNLIWNKFLFTKDNYEVKYVGNNMYKFYVDGKEYKHTTVLLHMYNQNMKEYKIGNMFGVIANEYDDKLIKEYSNIYMTTNDYIKLSKHIIHDNLRYLFYQIIKYKKIKPAYIKITTFNTCSHHVKQVAKVLDKNLLYIGLGDTLGGSEYGIYFGMASNIIFSKYICNLISL